MLLVFTFITSLSRDLELKVWITRCRHETA